MVSVDQEKAVEVQQVKAIAALADQQQRPPGKDRSDCVPAAKPKHKANEERQQNATVFDQIGQMRSRDIEEESESRERSRCNGQTLSLGDGNGELKSGKRNACHKGRGIRYRRVLQKPDQRRRGVASDWLRQMIGVEDEIQRRRQDVDHPETEKQKNQPGGLSRPRQQNQPRECCIEGHLGGERPCNGVPEGSQTWTQPLQQKGSHDKSLPELQWRARSPLQLKHLERDQQRKQVDRVEAREPGQPELPFHQRRPAVGIVIRKDVPGDQKEDVDEDKTILNERPQQTEMRRREVKQNDIEGKQCPNAGQRRQRWLARRLDGGCRRRNCRCRRGSQNGEYPFLGLLSTARK